MILNNKGWGLKEMLFFSAILFFCLLVVVFLINNLYSSIEENMSTNNHQTSSENNYEKVERNLAQAAKRYYKIHKDEIGEIIISDELIEENYLTVEKMTVDNDICEGYVLIEDNEYSPFITCASYETEGY